jgi:type II secretory pathway component PulJ
MRLIRLPLAIQRPNRSPKRQTGVTLAELLIGTAVGALVLVGISTTYVLGVRATAQNVAQARLSQELRAAMEIMQQDIRRAGYWSFPSDEPSDPADNPFQRTLDGIDNDLRTGAASGEAAASCLLYAYDSDLTGEVGVCSGCSPAGFANSLFDRASMEMFGWRLKEGAIQMRTGLLPANSDVTFTCTSGSWEKVTSDDVDVTVLGFEIASTTANLNPSKSVTAPCAENDPCRDSRVVEILLAGELSADPSVRQRLRGNAAVRNDRYFVRD